MTQLILDGIEMPESQKGGYKAWPEPLSVDVQMVSGRTVREVKGSVWKASYQYGYFTDEMKEKVISACERGRRSGIYCGLLTPNSNTLYYSTFLVMGFTYPKFMWSRLVDGAEGSTPVPVWADFSVELQEVRPHD